MKLLRLISQNVEGFRKEVWSNEKGATLQGTLLKCRGCELRLTMTLQVYVAVIGDKEGNHLILEQKCFRTFFSDRLYTSNFSIV